MNKPLPDVDETPIEIPPLQVVVCYPTDTGYADYKCEVRGDCEFDPNHRPWGVRFGPFIFHKGKCYLQAKLDTGKFRTFKLELIKGIEISK